MSGWQSLCRATQYLMGTHPIAERIFRHDPAAMLHAPLRTVLYADPDGDTQLAIDQPGLLFGSYGNRKIADVGRELDTLLAQLITLLGGDPPLQLGVKPARHRQLSQRPSHPLTTRRRSLADRVPRRAVLFYATDDEARGLGRVCPARRGLGPPKQISWPQTGVRRG